MNQAVERPTDAAEHELDVVGIGALNLDYIVDTSLDAHAKRLIDAGILGEDDERAVPFPWGTESAVDEATVFGVLQWVESRAIKASLGGSAYNAIFALARMRLDLRLGYVGIAGRISMPGLSALAELERHGVETSKVRVTPTVTAGVCLSLLDRGERTLLTHGGANDLMSSFIDEEFAAILAYLRRARLVHVTSFLDDKTPAHMLRLLQALRASKPTATICLDPGHVWSTAASDEVVGLIRLCNYLLLNHNEFHALSRRLGTPPEDEEAAAAQLLALIEDRNAAILVKRASGITVYRRRGVYLTSDTLSRRPIPDEEIKDATGAGDVFAAGLLAALASRRLQLELGALLGMTLARHKLRYVGSQGHSELAHLTRRFIASRNAGRMEGNAAKGIFLAHGGDAQWFAVREFLTAHFAVPVQSFESGVWGSSQVSDVLNRYLTTCNLAVCILTAEDLVQAGRGFARQNVIHEVGLFQGRYGPDRVVILVEDDCEFLPDIGSTPPMVFAKHSVRDVYWSLREELLRKGVPDRSP